MATGNSGQLDGGRFLVDQFTKNPIQASFFQKIITAINRLSTAAAVSPTGDLPAPPPINGINVKTSGEILHATVIHAAPIQRGIQYQWEISAGDSSFSAPLPFDTGSSRTLITTLPTKNDGGSTVNYYIRAFPQYQGSQPATPTVYGGANGATPITMSGSTHMTLLTSTGSGTASTNGQQGGWGLGKILQRPASTPAS
jgi:hypothetical protein